MEAHKRRRSEGRHQCCPQRRFRVEVEVDHGRKGEVGMEAHWERGGDKGPMVEAQ